MSGILLLCTSKVPASVINRLMEECTFPENAFNIFSLVRTPEQESLDEYSTDPPVQDFDTGFEGKSDAKLRAFVKDRIKKHRSTRSSCLDDAWIVVLDDKSASQNAVVMHYSYPREYWDDNPITGPAEVFDNDIWWKWRVPFKATWIFFIGIDRIPWDYIEIYSRPEYLGEDGVLVWQIPGMVMRD